MHFQKFLLRSIEEDKSSYEVETSYFQFDVRRNVASILLTKDDTRVEIKYEPVYPNTSITHQATLVTTIEKNLPQTPDMSIEVYHQNIPVQVLIFDAKYRRQRDSSGTYSPDEESIDKMYRYKENIQYQKYDPILRRFRPQSIVSAAYILYPGNQVLSEADDKIGAIPLLPGMSPHLQSKAKGKLVDLLKNVYLI